MNRQMLEPKVQGWMALERRAVTMKASNLPMGLLCSQRRGVEVSNVVYCFRESQ